MNLLWSNIWLDIAMNDNSRPLKKGLGKTRALMILGTVALLTVAGVAGYIYLHAHSIQTSISSHQTGTVRITSASISSYSIPLAGQEVTVTVENTGSSNLVGLGNPSITLGGSVYLFSWNPMPSPTYPIYTGEQVTGTGYLSTQYRSGLQVTVSVTATFRDGSHMEASTVITVS